MRRTWRDLRDDAGDVGVERFHTRQQITRQFGILQGENLLERGAITAGRVRKRFVQVSLEQHVELAHAATTGPRQAAALLRTYRGGVTHPLSVLPFDDQLLDLGDRLGRVEILGAHLSAIHDRMAAIQLERVFQLVETLAERFVTTVHDPAVGR